MTYENCKHVNSYFRSNSYEGNVYSPEFWSNSYSNVYSSQTFSVILQGQIWSSLFGHVTSPHFCRVFFNFSTVQKMVLTMSEYY